MHLIVLSTLPYHKIVTDRIVEVYPESSVVFMTQYDYINQESKLKARPFFSDSYQVFVEYSRNGEYWKHITKWAGIEWVRLIIMCPFKVAYLDAQEKLHSVGAKFEKFNSYLTDFPTKAKFIQHKFEEITYGEKELPYKMATYIASRLRGNESQMDFVLGQLAQAQTISYRSIAKVLPAQRTITLSNFMMKLLGEGDFPYKDLLELLTRYRYYTTPLLNAMIDFTDQWFKLFEEFISGKFNSMNVLNWTSEIGHSKEFKITSTAQANDWLYMLEHYSYELMIVFRTDLNDIKKLPYRTQFVRVLKWIEIFMEFKHSTLLSDRKVNLLEDIRNEEYQIQKMQAHARMQDKIRKYQEQKALKGNSKNSSELSNLNSIKDTSDLYVDVKPRNELQISESAATLAKGVNSNQLDDTVFTDKFKDSTN